MQTDAAPVSEPFLKNTEPSPWITDLQEIERQSLKHASEDKKFAEFLKTQDSQAVDGLVQSLSQNVAAGIDCTKCANCCKSLTVAINYQDMSAIADTLEIEVQVFKSRFMKKESDKGLVLNRKPCPFLKNNLCSVYENRPATCRTYPHLEKGQLISRLGNVLSNLAVCPIAFNTFELLKLNFE